MLETVGKMEHRSTRDHVYDEIRIPQEKSVKHTGRPPLGFEVSSDGYLVAGKDYQEVAETLEA